VFPLNSLFSYLQKKILIFCFRTCKKNLNVSQHKSKPRGLADAMWHLFPAAIHSLHHTIRYCLQHIQKLSLAYDQLPAQLCLHKIFSDIHVQRKGTNLQIEHPATQHKLASRNQCREIQHLNCPFEKCKQYKE
jgi:hypothetical protein